MAKLNAEIRSDRGGRTVQKTGDEYIEIELTYKGLPNYWVTFNEFGIIVEGDGGELLNTGNSKRQK